ncbi:MAG TPA: ammonium transporter [Ignavibacteriaceae bacterium]|nr:ammonium transporter [Ignavibacteriaceae bacterium]
MQIFIPCSKQKISQVCLLVLFILINTSDVFSQDSLKVSQPSLEQRVAGIEAYLQNTDPSAPLKGPDGKIGISSPSVGVPGPGHNAWMMISAALVLFMTLPGLALFYGGLVRQKNVLSVLAQCLGIAGLVTILWWICGYSLVFGEGGGYFFGSLKHTFLRGVTSAPDTNYTFWVSENVFTMYQMMFAIITPALIIGAIAERMKYSAVLLFVLIWMFAVYFPLAHMVWGIDGLMNGVWNGNAKISAIDFAGGTVVHMSSGWSALILCLILGKRIGFGREPMPPHNMVLCMVGTGMLWVGWYGFNAGSALAADGIAANAFATTTIAAAVASFTWPMAEWIFRGKPSVLGFCSGAVAGLVVITPACGFVDISGAVIIGLFAGFIPFFAVWKLKAWLGYDDALDTFGVHAVGGTIGALLTGFLATSKVNPNLTHANVSADQNGLAALIANGGLVGEQLKAIAITLLLSVTATLIIAYIVKAIIGLRPSGEVEVAGLDLSEHGEEGYHTA